MDVKEKQFFVFLFSLLLLLSYSRQYIIDILYRYSSSPFSLSHSGHHFSSSPSSFSVTHYHSFPLPPLCSPSQIHTHTHLLRRKISLKNGVLLQDQPSSMCVCACVSVCISLSLSLYQYVCVCVCVCVYVYGNTSLKNGVLGINPSVLCKCSSWNKVLVATYNGFSCSEINLACKLSFSSRVS